MYNLNIRGYGGTGRRVGLRIQWETMQVRFLLSTPKMTEFLLRHFFVCRNQTYGSLTCRDGYPFVALRHFPYQGNPPRKLQFAFPLLRGINPLIIYTHTKHNLNIYLCLQFCFIIRIYKNQ